MVSILLAPILVTILLILVKSYLYIVLELLSSRCDGVAGASSLTLAPKLLFWLPVVWLHSQNVWFTCLECVLCQHSILLGRLWNLCL
ncbi:hypothetical protein B0J11DRAFT_524498 [Dendryphion nanum]|uniref:Uncharacterized protein n=1 Tax=Dendryphion nanum TaxID=256645 RepID=A0A9P9DZZ7_9PLEO|nr:hypothetical protein B0J11DRAFT_524498 [Dendryphion nanum]